MNTEFLNNYSIFLAMAMGFVILASQIPVYADTITPINDKMSLQVNESVMSVPDNEELTWATIRGQVSNPVDWYPVIIQIFKDNEAVHFAQVELRGDDTFQYQFKMQNVGDNGKVSRFDGNYTVKIFAVVYSESNRV